MKADFCFPKSNRLLSKNDFSSLRDGSRFFVSGVIVSYAKKSENDFCRIGIAVSKKYGNAVKRNEFKRHVREIFRKKISLSGYDILIVPNLRKIKNKNLKCEYVIQNIESSFLELEHKLSEF